MEHRYKFGATKTFSDAWEAFERRRADMRKRKSMRVGGGGRFRKLARKVGSKKLAAFIGRKKYGKRRFQKMAAAGRRRARKSRK